MSSRIRLPSPRTAQHDTGQKILSCETRVNCVDRSQPLGRQRTQMYNLGKPGHRHSAFVAGRLLALAYFLTLVSGSFALSQIQSPPQSSASRVIQLPLSGRQPGGTTVQQSSTPPPGSSVNTVNTQIQVPGAYNGSIPGRDTPSGSITLTLDEAVLRGLATNLGIIGGDAASMQARAQRLQARSSLLPNISGSVAENAAKINLASEGFSSSEFGNAIPF
jgi:hypothetical protein